MLVDYDDSDADDFTPPPAEPKKKKKKIVVAAARDVEERPVKKTKTSAGSALSELLPSPKNASKSAPQAAKAPSAASAPLIPESVKTRSKASGKSKPPNVSLFSYETKSSRVPDRETAAYEPVFVKGNGGGTAALDELAQEELAAPKHEPELDEAAIRRIEGGRNRGPINILDYNVESEYRANEEANRVRAPAAAPIQAIGSGRHQITSLLNSVQAQRESFEETFAQNRRAKTEAKARYGF